MKWPLSLTAAVLCLLPAAAGIECYHCVADLSTGESCATPTYSMTCPSSSDSCVTISLKMKAEFGGMSSNGMTCGMKDSCAAVQRDTCGNSTGVFEQCSVTCCQEDLCNSGAPAVEPTTLMPKTEAVKDATTSPPEAAGIECYHCVADLSTGESCATPTYSMTCPSSSDSCVTISLKMKAEFGGMSSNGMTCGMKDSCAAVQRDTCGNSTGVFEQCSVTCCQEDLCNSGAPAVEPTTLMPKTEAVKDATTSPPEAAGGIECYECTPDLEKGDMCTNPTKTTKCASFYDSCMTISTRVKSLAGEMAFESMSCGYRAGCELAKQHACDNSTGMLDECSVSCCQGDLCNSGSGETTPPKADRIKCYQCTPDPQRGELCANPTNISTCEWYFDSCMSVSMTGKMPDGSAMAVAAMGCGVTGACDQHPGTVCDYANATGMVDQCLVSCCQGDLCNSEAPSAQPTMVVTSTSEDPTTFPPEADGIKCYQCTPDPLNVETCGHPTTTVTCPSLYDSCASFSVKMKMPGGDEVSSAAMTCGSTVTCDQAQQAACDAANVTGTVTQCSLSCCLEDLCNSGAQTVEPTAATEASTGEDSTTSTAGDDGIKCYQCTPDPLNGETCEHPTTTITCPSFYDSCASVSFKMKMQGSEVSYAGMTCGSTATCDQAQQAACKAANATGMATQCSLSCCQEDLCNSGAQTAEPATAVPATEATTGEDATTSPAGVDELKCYQCIPDVATGEMCASPTVTTTCPPFHDSCVSFLLTVNAPVVGKIPVASMTCGVKESCSAHAQEAACTAANVTGTVDHCSLNCCQQDLCNDGSAIPTAVVPTAEGVTTHDATKPPRSTTKPTRPHRCPYRFSLRKRNRGKPRPRH